MAQGSAQNYGEVLVFDQLPSLNAYINTYRQSHPDSLHRHASGHASLVKSHGEHLYHIMDPNNPDNVLESFGRVNDPVHRGL